MVVARCAPAIPIAVGLDHRDGVVALEGWTEASTLQLSDALNLYPTADAFVITDISRDTVSSCYGTCDSRNHGTVLTGESGYTHTRKRVPSYHVLTRTRLTLTNGKLILLVAIVNVFMNTFQLGRIH